MVREQFRVSLKKYLQSAGISLKTLADTIGLHQQVLSRKLSGISSSQLTHTEIKKIIVTLATWKVISTLDQASELLGQLELKANIFSNEEWESYPLNQLEKPLLNSHQQVRTTLATYTETSSASARIFHLNNLPVQLTRLIGREWVVEKICELLTAPHTCIVSLIGPGGSGKTRLAIEVGRVIETHFYEGVCFVNLAEVNEVAWVGSAIAQTLGLASTDSPDQLSNLKDFLRDKQLLLILDNFEHLVEAAGLVEELLKAAPGVKIIVTSRVVLGLYGEKEFAVPALNLPDAIDLVNRFNYQKYDAIELFIERVKAVIPDMVVSDEVIWQATKIATQLDGLPLALELAASRVKLLPLPVLLERLTAHKLDLLSNGARNLPSRQRALRNTLDWSYHLLEPAEQQLFQKLGVFRGSFSLEEVQVICSDASEDGVYKATGMLDRLGDLLNNSLITPAQLQEASYGISLQASSLILSTRFRMLETFREYALEKLCEADELSHLKLVHFQYYIRVLENAREQLNGPDLNTWLNFLDSSLPNIRTACESCLSLIELSEIIPEKRESYIFDGLRMCRNLVNYWDIRGVYVEGKLFTGQILEAARQAGLNDTFEYAWALTTLGIMTGRLGEFNQSQTILDESLALFERLGERTGEATTLKFKGEFMQLCGDYAQSLQLFSRAEEICRQSNDNFTLGTVLTGAAFLHKTLGNFATNNEKLTEALQIFESQDNKRWIAGCWFELGAAAMAQRQLNTALFYLQKCLIMHLEQGDYRILAFDYRSLATVAYVQADYTNAENYLINSLRLSCRTGDKYQIGMSLALMSILNVTKYELDSCDKLPEERNQYLRVTARLMGGCEAQFNLAQAVINPIYEDAYNESVAKARNILGETEFIANYTQGLTTPLALILKNFSSQPLLSYISSNSHL